MVHVAVFPLQHYAGCNSNEGGYFDNIACHSWTCRRARSGERGECRGDRSVSSDIWQFVNDTFPANETAGLPARGVRHHDRAHPYRAQQCTGDG